MTAARAFGHVLVVALVALAGCGGDEREGEPAGRGLAEGSDIFPGETLQAWRSYADHLVVFRVVDERELPSIPSADAAPDEGLVGREATLEVVRTLWSAEGAPAVGPRITMRVPGWILGDGKRGELQIRGGPRLEVGGTYLAPLLFTDGSHVAEWSPLTISSQLPVESERIAAPAEAESGVLRTRFAGRTVDEVADALRASEPDPAVVPHMSLRPVPRLEAVREEQRGG